MSEWRSDERGWELGRRGGNGQRSKCVRVRWKPVLWQDVYEKKSCGQVVDDQETNPDLLAIQNFMNDQSSIISEKGSEMCCDDQEGVQSMGQHTRYEQSTRYPIDKYVLNMKVSKNFKCFISIRMCQERMTLNDIFYRKYERLERREKFYWATCLISHTNPNLLHWKEITINN